jgi:RNA polymerase sigma-70 factor (ECF subfamily)
MVKTPVPRWIGHPLLLLFVTLMTRAAIAKPFDLGGHDWEGCSDFIQLAQAELGSRAYPTSTVELGELGPDDALARDETLGALLAAIDALPHDLKASILLHHYQQLSYREIAAITGCSERGVETRLYRARQHLKLELAEFFRETSQR